MASPSVTRNEAMMGLAIVMRKVMQVMTDDTRQTRGSQTTPTMFNIGAISPETLRREFTSEDFLPNNILGKLYRQWFEAPEVNVNLNKEMFQFIVRLATFFDHNDIFTIEEMGIFRKYAQWSMGGEVSVTKLTFSKMLRTFRIDFREDQYQYPANPILCFRVLIERISGLVSQALEKKELGMRAILGWSTLVNKFKQFQEQTTILRGLRDTSQRTEEQNIMMNQLFTAASKENIDIFRLLSSIPAAFNEWNEYQLTEKIDRITNQDEAISLLGIVQYDSWENILRHADGSEVNTDDDEELTNWFLSFKLVNHFMIRQEDGIQFMKHFRCLQIIQTKYDDIISEWSSLHKVLVDQRLILPTVPLPNYMLQFNVNQNTGEVVSVLMPEVIRPHQNQQGPTSNPAVVEIHNRDGQTSDLNRDTGGGQSPHNRSFSDAGNMSPGVNNPDEVTHVETSSISGGNVGQRQTPDDPALTAPSTTVTNNQMLGGNNVTSVPLSGSQAGNFTPQAVLAPGTIGNLTLQPPHGGQVTMGGVATHMSPTMAGLQPSPQFQGLVTTHPPTLGNNLVMQQMNMNGPNQNLISTAHPYSHVQSMASRMVGNQMTMPMSTIPSGHFVVGGLLGHGHGSVYPGGPSTMAGPSGAQYNLSQQMMNQAVISQSAPIIAATMAQTGNPNIVGHGYMPPPITLNQGNMGPQSG